MPASLPPRFSSAHSKPPLKDYRPCIYAWSPITCIESRHDSFDHGELHSCTAPGAPKADSIINVSQITKRYLESPRELKRIWPGIEGVKCDPEKVISRVVGDKIERRMEIEAKRVYIYFVSMVSTLRQALLHDIHPQSLER